MSKTLIANRAVLGTTATAPLLLAFSIGTFAAPRAGAGEGVAAADPAITFVADYGFHAGRYRRDLMVANADGTNRAAIWSRSRRQWNPTALLDYPTWSPDVDSDAANGFQGTIALQARDDAREAHILWLIDVVITDGIPRGINVREVVASDVDPVAGSILQPAWSPDLDALTPGYQGKIAYFGSSGGEWCVSAIEVSWDGTTVQPTHGPSSSAVLSTAGHWEPTWSPDGSLIAVEGPDNSLLILDAVTGAIVETLMTAMDAQFPNWSRTGWRIAYRELTPPQAWLWTVDVALGAESAQLVSATPCAFTQPVWSPDDRYLLINQLPCVGTKDYATINLVEVATGATITLIAEPKLNLRDPDWRRF